MTSSPLALNEGVVAVAVDVVVVVGEKRGRQRNAQFADRTHRAATTTFLDYHHVQVHDHVHAHDQAP